MPSRKEAKGILENGKIFNLLALCTDHVNKSPRDYVSDHVRISRGHIRLVLLPHFSFLFFFSPFRTTGYIMS